jgi:hypothetical protein
MQKPERVALYSLLGLVGILVMLGVLLLWLQSGLRVAGVTTPEIPGHSPLQEAEFESGAERAAVEGPEKAKLDSYGWVDRKKGIVHIPVDRAVKILEGR